MTAPACRESSRTGEADSEVMGASENIYRARGAESGATEPEGQPMYRTPLGSALVANWQYLILASGPHPCDPDPLVLESKKL